jgi:hypothetical protein
MLLCVGADERGRCTLLFGDCARGSDHLLGNVDANRTALRADQLSDSARRATGAAADVEHLPRAAGRNLCNEQILEWLQCPIEHGLRLVAVSLPRSSPACLPRTETALCHFKST